MRSNSSGAVVGLVCSALAACSGDDSGQVEIRGATPDECPAGGIVVSEGNKSFPVCNGTDTGGVGPAGPAGEPGPVGPPGLQGAAGSNASSMGAMVASAGCSRYEDQSRLGYGFSLVVFDSGISFADLSFDTPLTSGNTSMFFPPGVNPASTFVDGVDADVARLDGVFVQTIDIANQRWTVSQEANPYFDVPIIDGEFCSESWNP